MAARHEKATITPPLLTQLKQTQSRIDIDGF